MTFHKLRGLGAIGVLAGALLMHAACSSDGDTAQASGTGIDRTTHALTVGQLSSVDGSYSAACRNRLSGAWSVRISGIIPLTNPALTVVLNDTACVLTLTAVHTDAGVIAAVTPLVLTASYLATPSAFASPIAFYANARLSAVTFAGDFVLNLLYSDDARLATADNTALFQVVQSTATALSVDAPTYTFDPAGLALLTDINQVVQSAVGTAALTAGSVLGQTYVVVNASGLTTYAQLDTAYTGATSVPIATTIPAASFTTVGTNLTANQVRTVIIANTSSGVRSYQRFQLTFHPAI
jgi:hypothetical protein